MRSVYPKQLIGDVLKLEYGKPLPQSDRSGNGKIPAYGANGMLCWSTKAYRTKRSIIVGRKGSAGEINLTDGPYWPTDVTYFVEHNDNETDLNYLYHLLKYLDLPKLAKGVKPGINRNDVYAIKAPIPPLPEQKRIVAILDEAFAGIDKAIASTQQNLANARELFESYVHGLLIKNNNDWSVKKLGEVCNLYQGLAINKGTKHLLVKNSNLPLLRIKDLRNNSEEQYVSESGFPPNSEIFPEDIIYTRTGQIGLVFRGRRGVLHNNSFKIESSAELDRNYLYWWLQEPLFKQKITSLASRAAQPDITHKIFKNQEILLPPLNYQKNAAEKIDCVYLESEKLSDLYRQKLPSLSELKQSLLQKAFSGELTADELPIKEEAVA